MAGWSLYCGRKQFSDKEAQYPVPVDKDEAWSSAVDREHVSHHLVIQSVSINCVGSTVAMALLLKLNIAPNCATRSCVTGRSCSNMFTQYQIPPLYTHATYKTIKTHHSGMNRRSPAGRRAVEASQDPIFCLTGTLYCWDGTEASWKSMAL